MFVEKDYICAHKPDSLWIYSNDVFLYLIYKLWKFENGSDKKFKLKWKLMTSSVA